MINEIKEKILDEIRCGELNNENGLLPTWLNKPEIPHYAEYMRCFQDGVTCKQYTDAVIVKNIFKEFEKANVSDTNVGEWIPCSERLPKEEGWYLATVKVNCNLEIIAVRMILFKRANKAGKKKWYRQGQGNEVLAWMPLPPTYKEDTNGKND